MDYRKYFSLPDDEIYFNCAGQGPLSLAASQAVIKSIKDKEHPKNMDMNYGAERSQACREAVSKLIDHPSDLIALADSTGWGVNLIAQGLELKSGDTVALFEGQFPSNVAPWTLLTKNGVKIQKIISENSCVDLKVFEKSLGPSVKAVSLEWVHWISGDRIPLSEMIEICHKKNILVVVDVTQGLGAIPFSFKDYQADAVVCSAYKWLFSPYGSGFFAMSPKMLERLCPSHSNWLSFQSVMAGNLCRYEIDPCTTARRFDVFSHMGYLNLAGMTASIEWLNSLDLDQTYRHARGLHDQLGETLNPKYFTKLNQGESERQSLISTFKIHGLDALALDEKFKNKNISVTIRDGHVRFSQHFYNTQNQVEKVVALANSR